MQETRSEKKRKPRRYGMIFTGLFLVVWFSGAAGWMVRSLAIQWVPHSGRGYTITGTDALGFSDPATGIVLRVNAPRLKKLAHEALGWKAYAIPPGMIPERLAIAGSIRVLLDDEATETWLPFVFTIQPETPHPYLSVRLPSDLVNQALLYDGSFAHKDKKKKYALGHYNIIHSLRFDTATLHSAPDGKRPITFRKIDGYATGEVRFKLKENLFSARSTARVRKMDLKCDLDFRQYVDGIGLAYKITIPKLDADINNLAPMFESRPVEAIRKALEDSIARPRNLEKLARKRLPSYIPLDIEIDIEVFEVP